MKTEKLEGFMPDVVQSYAQSGQAGQALQIAQSQGLAWVLPGVARGFALSGLRILKIGQGR